MSNPCENFSQNSSEAYQLTGKEIVQYQSQPPPEMGKEFRKMVSTRMSPMRAKITPQKKMAKNTSEKAIVAIPVSTMMGEDAVPNAVSGGEAEGKEISRQRHIVIDRYYDVDFELTEGCMAYLKEIYHLSINPERRCSFAESLKNWSIELRQRPNEKCDFYYKHPSAGRLLRSMVEVVHFLLNGVPPCGNRTKQRMKAIKDNSVHNAIAKATKVRRPRKSTSIDKRRGKRVKAKEVEVRQPVEEEVDPNPRVFDESELFPMELTESGSWNEVGLDDCDLINEIPICDMAFQFPGM